MKLRLLIVCGALVLIGAGCRQYQLEKWVYDPFKWSQWQQKKKKLGAAEPVGQSMTPVSRPAPPPMDSGRGRW